jgi:hypothetical protein
VPRSDDALTRCPWKRALRSPSRLALSRHTRSAPLPRFVQGGSESARADTAACRGGGSRYLRLTETGSHLRNSVRGTSIGPSRCAWSLMRRRCATSTSEGGSKNESPYAHTVKPSGPTPSISTTKGVWVALLVPFPATRQQVTWPWLKHLRSLTGRLPVSPREAKRRKRGRTFSFHGQRRVRFRAPSIATVARRSAAAAAFASKRHSPENAPECRCSSSCRRANPARWSDQPG